MISFSGSLKIFLLVDCCDMRKGFNGLYGLVSSGFGEDPRSGALYVFCNRRHTRIKVLYFDGAVPEEQRKQMIEAYGTRQAVELLIEHVLTAVPIPKKLREMIIEDTLRGAPQAKRAWPEAGMIEDIS